MSHGNIVLRTNISHGDTEFIRDIVSSTGFFRPDEILVAVELAEERLAKGKSSGYEFVFAEVDGRVAAYSCFGLIPCSLISWDLYWIATGKDFQNRGLGKLILRKTEDIVRDAGGKTIYIETSSKPLYKPTQDFYLRNQCELIANFEDFYAIGDNKLVFCKKLF